MTTEEALAAAVVEPVNGIFEIDPETRVITVPASEKLFGVANGGLGFNYNAQTYFGQYDVEVINHLIFAMNKAYYTLETDKEFMPYVEVINTHAQFDADNAFPTTIKNVNTRSSKTESIGTNGVHPTNNGYWQIADAEFRALLAN